MQIKLSKQQWEDAGKKGGWLKTAAPALYADKLPPLDPNRSFFDKFDKKPVPAAKAPAAPGTARNPAVIQLATSIKSLSSKLSPNIQQEISGITGQFITALDKAFDKQEQSNPQMPKFH